MAIARTVRRSDRLPCCRGSAEHAHVVVILADHIGYGESPATDGAAGRFAGLTPMHDEIVQRAPAAHGYFRPGLRPMLAHPAGRHKDPAFSLVTRGPQRFGRTVTTARWRFTQWSDGATALYDPDADPEETCNASADEANAPVVAELRQKPVSLPPWPAPAGK